MNAIGAAVLEPTCLRNFEAKGRDFDACDTDLQPEMQTPVGDMDYGVSRRMFCVQKITRVPNQYRETQTERMKPLLVVLR